MANNTKKNTILADHKKVSSRFIPPFLQHFPNMEYVRWKVAGLPELIWLGLLEHELGLKEAARLSITLAQAAQSSSATSWFGAMSSYSALSNEEQDAVIAKLMESNDLKHFQKALNALIYFYPEAPLAFIFRQQSPLVGNEVEALQNFKTFLTEYSYKYEKKATLAQANSIYIAFVIGRLKVVKGLALENFPAIADFPDTEESKRIARSIYTTSNMYMSQTVNEFGEGGLTPWANYFWNRGLQLEPCSFGNEGDEDEL